MVLQAWGMNRPSLCVAGTGCCCRNQRLNQNSNSRVSSWDLYCAAERMSINDEPYHTGRGLLSPPTKHSSVAAAVENHSNNGTGYYNNHQSLQYQKLQAIQVINHKQNSLKHLIFEFLCAIVLIGLFSFVFFRSISS